MKKESEYIIRSYQPSDREAVRSLCCQTGFLGEPIDPVYEDRELFADFLTTYYTDHEPESSFVIEKNGELRGYLLDVDAGKRGGTPGGMEDQRFETVNGSAVSRFLITVLR